MRTKTILAVAGAILAMLIVLVASTGGDSDQARSPVVESTPAIASPPAAPLLTIDRLTLRRGSTLDQLLQDAGFETELRLNVLDRLSQAMDLRRIPAGAGLSVSRSAAGEPVAVAVRAAADRFIRIELPDDPAGFEEVAIPVEVKTRTETGIVEQSVSQTFAGLPEAVGLTASFADIFQWDIDLLVEPRKGDQVRIVYERLSYGELPTDLPPFRGDLAGSGDPAGIGRILAATYRGEQASSTAYWVESDDGPGNYFDEDGTPLRKTFLKSPLNYRRISSGFSRARRNPVTRKVVPHHGVDFAAPSGTPVVAAADGRVASAGWSGALGKAIKIRHGSEYTTVYGHLRGYAKGIRAGAQVRQNQVIGYVGATGRATGPHLHYTMMVSGRAVNPLSFRNPPVEPLPENDRPKLAAMVRKHRAALQPKEIQAASVSVLP
ncbi:MAG: peptidoglycan DD-metalloendopeptidase family protein [Acidobacteria bacterium]|uniref:Peptidoglycan DD-metalloendopeptidase family protein n=1 Tax=Candidatus Polarisedimenticola svalbardensis TaxID=2886004 RepID=A0A8J6XUG8_9BACT|nr:peptidoglycan DD-metalloendopeptidase family protein [Candidatus Polarisedimenticola svalbardensis]